MSRMYPKSSPSAPCCGLALAGLLSVSTASAEQGAPPPAGKGYQEAQSDARAEHARRKPIAVVKDFYDKLGRGDVPGLLENFAMDAKWVLHGPSGIPFAGLHEGRDGIRKFIEIFGQNARVSKFETREFLADKHKVVVQGYEEAAAAPTGKTWKAHWTHIFTVHRGQIVFVDEVLDTAPVLAAFQP